MIHQPKHDDNEVAPKVVPNSGACAKAQKRRRKDSKTPLKKGRTAIAGGPNHEHEAKERHAKATEEEEKEQIGEKEKYRTC